MKVRKYNAVRNVLVFSLVFVMTLSSVSITSFANEMLLSEADTKTEMSSSEVLGGNQNFLFDTMSKVAAIGDTIELKYVPYNENLKDVVITFPENVSHVEGNWDNSQVEKQQNDVVISQEQPIASESSVPQDPTATTEPTDSQEPTATPEPTDSQEPTATLEPTESQEPTATIEPTVLQESIVTLEPTESQEPTATTEPTESQEPTATTETTESQQPLTTDKPSTTDEQNLNQSQQAPTEEAFEAIVVDGKNITIHNNVNKIGSVIVLKFKLEKADLTKFELNAKLNDEVLTASTEVFMAKTPRGVNDSPVKIDAFKVSSIATGTASFQATPSGYNQGDKPTDGDDYNADDTYVRSNDIVTYNLDVTIAPVDASAATLKNIVVRVEAQLDNAFTLKNGQKDYNAEFGRLLASSSTDATGLNKGYTDITFDLSSATKGLPIILQVYGAKNGVELKPSFKATLLSVDGTAYSQGEIEKTIGKAGDGTTMPVTTVSSRVSLDVTWALGTQGDRELNVVNYGAVFKSDPLPNDTFMNKDGKFLKTGVSVYAKPLSDAGVPRKDLKGATFPNSKKLDIHFKSTLKLAPVSPNVTPVAKDVHADITNPYKTKIAATQYNDDAKIEFNNYSKFNPNAPLDYNKVWSTVRNLTMGTDKDYSPSPIPSAHYRVFNTGKVDAANISTGNSSEQEHTVSFSDFGIGTIFPNSYYFANYYINNNENKYFLTTSMLMYIPTNEFTATGNLACTLNSSLIADKVTIYDENGANPQNITVNRISDFQMVKYPKGNYTVASFTRQYNNIDYDLNGVFATDNGGNDGKYKISYGGKYIQYGYAKLLGGDPGVGGMELIQKWDPTKITIQQIPYYGDYEGSPLLGDATLNKYYVGVMNGTQDFSVQSLDSKRRMDYTWHAIDATQDEITQALKIRNLENTTGKKVSAVLREDFNYMSTGTRGFIRTIQTVNGTTPTGDYNKDTYPFFSYGIVFKKQRNKADYNDINNITNDPFVKIVDGNKVWEIPNDPNDSSRSDYYKDEYQEYNAYSSTVYDADGNVTVNHSPDKRYGATILVLPYAVNVTKDTENKLPTGSQQVSFWPYETINWVLKPTFLIQTNNSTLDPATITIKDTIPKGLSYKLGSAMQDGKHIVPKDIVINADGSTTLIWELNGVVPGSVIGNITYDTVTDSNLNYGANGNSITLDGTAVISTPLDIRIDSLRTSVKHVTIGRMTGSELNKLVDKSLVEVNEPFTYSVGLNITTTTPQKKVALLDILPYDKDPLGSKIHGTYQVSNIKLGAGATKNPDIYYTNMPVKDIPSNLNNIDTSNGWTLYTSDSNKVVTATAVLAKYPMDISSADKIVPLEITLKPDKNKPEDIYVNQAATNSILDKQLNSNKVTTTVVNRTISGLAWLDENRDGKRDANETIFQNVPVALFTKSGSTYTKVTKDVTGADFTTTKTDGAGKYEFTNLANAIYYVGFGVDTDTYTISPTKKASVATDLNSDISQTEKTPIVARTAANYYLSVDNYPFKAPSAMTTFAESYKNIDAGMYVTPLPGKVVIKKLEKTLFNPVANVKFNIYNWDGIETDVSKIISQTPVNATPIETNADGTVDYIFATEKSYLVYESGVPEGYIGAKPAYFTLTVKSDGNVVFGSLKNDAVYSTDKPTMGGIVTLYNEPKAHIQLVKIDKVQLDEGTVVGYPKDSQAENPNGFVDFDGVKFEVFKLKDGGNPAVYDDYTIAVKFNDNANVVVGGGVGSQEELGNRTNVYPLSPFTKYLIKETQTVAGYDEAKLYEFYADVASDGVVSVKPTDKAKTIYGNIITGDNVAKGMEINPNYNDGNKTQVVINSNETPATQGINDLNTTFVAVPNMPVSGKIFIEKLETDTDTKINGAGFDIYEWDGKETDIEKIMLGKKINSDIVYTDLNGQLSFDFVVKKGYFAYERVIPSGYEDKPDSHAYFTVFMGIDGKAKFGNVKNKVLSTGANSLGSPIVKLTNDPIAHLQIVKIDKAQFDKGTVVGYPKESQTANPKGFIDFNDVRFEVYKLNENGTQFVESDYGSKVKISADSEIVIGGGASAKANERGNRSKIYQLSPLTEYFIKETKTNSGYDKNKLYGFFVSVDKDGIVSVKATDASSATYGAVLTGDNIGNGMEINPNFEKAGANGQSVVIDSNETPTTKDSNHLATTFVGVPNLKKVSSPGTTPDPTPDTTPDPTPDTTTDPRPDVTPSTSERVSSSEAPKPSEVDNSSEVPSRSVVNEAVEQNEEYENLDSNKLPFGNSNAKNNTVVPDDHETIDSERIPFSNANAKKNPKTGDNVNYVGLVVSAISAGMFGVYLVIKRRKNESE